MADTTHSIPDNPDNPAAIRELRRHLSFTQPGFAARLGVSVDTVKSWETGRNGPSPDNIRRMRQLASGQSMGLRELAGTLREAAETLERDDTGDLAGEVRRLADALDAHAEGASGGH